jgi:hypothetical protein
MGLLSITHRRKKTIVKDHLSLLENHNRDNEWPYVHERTLITSKTPKEYVKCLISTCIVADHCH